MAYCRESTASLAEKKVVDANSFAWKSKLRCYYVVSEDNYSLETQLMTSSIEYSYKYVGDSCRLVITPLSERKYFEFSFLLNFMT